MDLASRFTPDNVRWILIGVFVLLVSVALHEFGHAMMANLLGDDTPRRQGRVTLNPLAHADPIGTFLLPLFAGLFMHGAVGGHLNQPAGGFGWGKPVQWQPSRVNKKWRMATANILVSIAGPAMNVLLAVVLAVVHILLVRHRVIAPAGNASVCLGFAVTTNFVLFFFNLLPIPPLDGGHVAEAFMPYRYRGTFEQYARFGPFLVMAFAFIPQLAQVFLVPAGYCADHVYMALSAIFGG